MIVGIWNADGAFLGTTVVDHNTPMAFLSATILPTGPQFVAFAIYYTALRAGGTLYRFYAPNGLAARAVAERARAVASAFVPAGKTLDCVTSS